jgi:hypothetical protein
MRFQSGVVVLGDGDMVIFLGKVGDTAPSPAKQGRVGEGFAFDPD